MYYVMYDKNLNNMRIWSIPTKLQTVFHIYVFLYFISQNPLKVRILSIFPNWIPTLKITNFSWYNLYEYPMYEWLDSTKYVCGIFVGSPCPMTWTFKASLGIWNDIFFYLCSMFSTSQGLLDALVYLSLTTWPCYKMF